MAIRILLSKVMGNQKTKTDGSNSIFSVVGKQKMKTDSRMPFSEDVENEKRNWKFEFRVPISQENGWH